MNMKKTLFSEVENKIQLQEVAKSSMKLIVKSPFREFKKGDLISDAEEVKKIVECHEKNMVNKIIL